MVFDLALMLEMWLDAIRAASCFAPGPVPGHIYLAILGVFQTVRSYKRATQLHACSQRINAHEML